MLPLFEPGTRLPVRIDPARAGNLVEAEFVTVTKDWQDGGPGLAPTKAGGVNITVDRAPAAGFILGVLQSGGAPGDHDTVITAPAVVEVMASAAVAPGAVVEVAANGQAVTRTAGAAVGLALSRASGAATKLIIKLL